MSLTIISLPQSTNQSTQYSHYLSQYRYETEKRKQTRQAEDDHATWLEEQKKELQALKMKQALAKEQRILNLQLEQMGPPRDGNNNNNNNSNKQQQSDSSAMPAAAADKGGMDLVSMEEAGVGAMPVPMDLASGVSALVDGLFLPTPSQLEVIEGSVVEALTDQSVFRVVVGIYDKGGESVARLTQSSWQPFNAGTVGNHTLPDVGGVGDATTEAAAVQAKDGAAAGNAAADWMLAPVKRTLKKTERELEDGLRVLVEIQFAESKSTTSEPSSLGWGIFPLVGTETGPGGRGLPPNGQSGPEDMFLCNGFWRVTIRKGVSDAMANPNEIPGVEGGHMSDVDLPFFPESFVLLRIGDSAEMQRQYAWLPTTRPDQLTTAKDVKRLYKDPFAPPNMSASPSEASLSVDKYRPASKTGARSSTYSVYLCSSFFLVCDVSASLFSIYCCLPACLPAFSDTT
jgi:hypothetical protein